MIAAVGTGKTFALLLKAWIHCKENNDALALIVRREYTDLRDSTMQDFETYFNVSINSQDKEYCFDNGSKVMFRHGDMADINVLKNINLSFIGIEQAEEYETADVFDFLRDRLRRKIFDKDGNEKVGVRQMALIANSRGRNWMWQRWINKAESVETINHETGESVYRRGEYECITANTFANVKHLPEDFVEDLRRKKEDAPNHYRQYVINSFDDVDDNDCLITHNDEMVSINTEFTFNWVYTYRVMGIDVARYGNDTSCAVVLEQRGPSHWDLLHCITWKHKDTMETTGRIVDLKQQYMPQVTVIDGDGMGVGPLDRLREVGVDVIEFRGGKVDGVDTNRYSNLKAQEYFMLKDMMGSGKFRVRNEQVMNSLKTVMYTFQSNGKRIIVSKEKMRSMGLKSPDEADAVMMARYGTMFVPETASRYRPQQQYAIMGGKFSGAGKYAK
jgi:hypothetical protein